LTSLGDVDSTRLLPRMMLPATLEARPWGIHSLQKKGSASGLSN